MAQVNTKLQIQDPPDIESTRRSYFLREKARNDYVSAMTLATRKGRQEERRVVIQEMILEGLRLGVPLETIAQMAKQPLDYVKSVIDKKIKVKACHLRMRAYLCYI